MLSHLVPRTLISLATHILHRQNGASCGRYRLTIQALVTVPQPTALSFVLFLLSVSSSRQISNFTEIIIRAASGLPDLLYKGDVSVAWPAKDMP